MNKEQERKSKILEQSDNLKSKGLNLKEIRQIVGAIKRWPKAKRELLYNCK